MSILMVNTLNPIAIERKWSLALDGHLFCYGQREPYKNSSLSSSLNDCRSDSSCSSHNTLG
jgi:hypothetical protein